MRSGIACHVVAMLLTPAADGVAKTLAAIVAGGLVSLLPPGTPLSFRRAIG